MNLQYYLYKVCRFIIRFVNERLYLLYIGIHIVYNLYSGKKPVVYFVVISSILKFRHMIINIYMQRMDQIRVYSEGMGTHKGTERLNPFGT